MDKDPLGCIWTHRGQRQAKVGGLMLHLDLDLVEQRLDSLVLKSVPVSVEKRRNSNILFRCRHSFSFHSDAVPL